MFEIIALPAFPSQKNKRFKNLIAYLSTTQHNFSNYRSFEIKAK